MELADKASLKKSYFIDFSVFFLSSLVILLKNNLTIPLRNSYSINDLY